MPLSPGERLGPYEIIAAIGAGGMGEVYRARDPRLDRDVAIKILPDTLAADPDWRSRLLREARAAGSLNHSNICTIYDVGDAGGHAYIAMEVVAGEPLSRRLASRSLPIDEIVRYGLQLADALGHAHDRGIVHRDLKSANVIVTADGLVKVLDFGLAKRTLLNDGADIATHTVTEGGVVSGTLPYMAPEQLRGAAADVRTDVWALGVVLYEIAAGVRPFDGRTGYELSSAILNEAPPPLPRHVPAGLDAVIRRSLEKEPARRYQRASEIRAALEMVERLPPSGRVRLTSRPTRARLPIVASAVAAVVVAAGILAWFASKGGPLGSRGGEIHSIAVLPLENLSRDPDQDYFAAGMHEALITDLAQIGLQKVIAKSSADAFKKSVKSPREIGQELGVEGLVTGSVLRANDRVQVTARLVRAETGAVLWAKRYERNAGDVLALQNELVGAIAREVRATVASSAMRPASRPVNPAAHDAYLRGRAAFASMAASGPTLPAVNAMIAQHERAIQLDPTYAPPYAALSEAYETAAQTSLVPPSDTFPKAKAAALKAVELDAQLPAAHAALANVFLWQDWNWTGAKEEIERALALSPDGLEALIASLNYEVLVARRADDAERISQRILSVDPLNPFSRIQRVWTAFFSRRYDDSVRNANTLLEVWPNNFMGTFFLASNYAVKRRRPETAAECRKVMAALSGTFNVHSIGMCAWALGIVGEMEDAHRLVHRLEQPPPDVWLDPAVMSTAYAGIGDVDRAFDWARQGIEQRAPNMIYTNAGPTWDSIRPDPRFDAMLRRMKFPP